MNEYGHAAGPDEKNGRAKSKGTSPLSHIFPERNSYIGDPKNENELLRFLHFNESGFNNLVVYLFWIVIAGWFTDYNHLSFPDEFIRKVRSALCEQYRVIYFNYLIRLK